MNEISENAKKELEKLNLLQYVNAASDTYPNIKDAWIVNEPKNGEWLYVEYLQLDGFLKRVCYQIEKPDIRFS